MKNMLEKQSKLSMSARKSMKKLLKEENDSIVFFASKAA